MLRKFSLFILFVFATSLFVGSTADAQSRFQQIQQGVKKSTAGGSEKEEEDYIDKDKLKKKGIDTKYSGSSGTRKNNKARLNSAIFLGVFETYLVKKRYNARLTVFAEPRKFALGHRACTKTRKIRDQINTYLFKNPPKTDKKGRIDPKGMDEGIRKAIKKALKTKLEYFTTIVVVNGRFSTHKIPKDLEGVEVSDCAGVINKKKELDKAAKG